MTTDATNSRVQQPCHVQKPAFHSSHHHYLDLTFFLSPLLPLSLSFGLEEVVVDDQSMAEHS